jgi:7-carboxy-7-deazaguanine synthase
MEHRNSVHVNHQKPAPRVYEGSGFLRVHSVFYTIQGEGPFAGRPAVFIRLNGCNLQCPGCDTDYTTTDEGWEPADLADHAISLFSAPTPPLIVISGGEPFRQNIIPLIGELQERRCTVQIETNGTLPLPKHSWAYMVSWPAVEIVCSPKAGKVNKSLERFITAYKYVVSAGDINPEDGLPNRALDHPCRPHLARPRDGFKHTRIYIQPVDPDPEGHHLAACIESAYDFGYTLCVQIHKIIGVE